ncbi:uridine kinase [Nocardioides sp. cx-173]|uniref:uridine kinase family protein n=1 Tax=Nocardioides sp. cx-173 TaxID=2898796 RepID=UPI001E347ED2|nr:(d)CMP kinase [Nocardioides sp. cx-173]MCD4526111.1 (d)CMP kinase [Nocardioides sp. cx-173]UGB43801.1 (d)CMP kinase [Nocardioides sp. cx-173]
MCIDGPAGSGKTTLARTVASLAEAPVVQMDDLYDGWDGLPRVTDQLDRLLLPLAEGVAGSYRRYDWGRQEYAETVTVAPAPLLVLEGVGAGSLAHAARCTVLAWVEAPDDLRLQRGLTRDGPEVEQQWRRWMRTEAEHFAEQRTRDRADVIVDGTAAAPPRSPGRVT